VIILPWDPVTFTPDININDTTNVLTLSNNYTDLSGNTGVTATSTNYAIDTEAPNITSFTTTTNTGYYKAGNSIVIIANTNKNIQSGSNITISLSSGASLTLTASSEGTTMTGTYIVSSSENTSQLSVSSFTINSVSDAVGNSMTSTIVPTGSNMFSNKVIVIDTTIPTIDTITKSWGDYLNDTEKLSDQTITVNTTGIEDNQTVSIILNSTTYTNTITNNSTIITIPNADLQSLNNGSITFTTNVADKAGNNATEISTSFVVDFNVPILAFSLPTDNQESVSINSKLILSFSEDMYVNSGNVVIYKSSDNSVFESIDVTTSQVSGSGSNYITISPSSSLALNTDYYIKIDDGAFRDIAENNYAGISSTTALNF